VIAGFELAGVCDELQATKKLEPNWLDRFAGWLLSCQVVVKIVQLIGIADRLQATKKLEPNWLNRCRGLVSLVLL
jgi:hypothetical protein